MNVGEIVAYAIRQAKKYGIEINREEIIHTLNAELSTIYFDLGHPVAIWESTSSKSSTADIISYPEDCIDVQKLFIGGSEANKLPPSEFEEKFKAD
jgi:hypothetical protein